MDKKSRRIVAVIVAGLMLVMSFAEVPAVFAAGEAGDEPAAVELQNTEDPEGVNGPEVFMDEALPEDEQDYELQDGEGDKADYTEVDKAIAKAEALDRDKYTADSLAAVDNAVAAVDRTKTEQAEVDAMAKAINDALDALVEKGEPGETVIQSNPVLINGVYYFIKLFSTRLNHYSKEWYQNYEGNAPIKLDARWYVGEETEDQGTKYVKASSTRAEAKCSDLAKFTYVLKATNGTPDDLTDDEIIKDNLTYDDICQKGKNKGLKMKAEGKEYYIEAKSGEEQKANSLPTNIKKDDRAHNVVKYVFPKTPKNVEVDCDDGDNVATISWDKVDGATCYAIYMSTNGKCPAKPVAHTDQNKGDSVTKYVKKALAGPKTYTFYVKAMFRNNSKQNGVNGDAAMWTISGKSNAAKLKISKRLLNSTIRVIRWKAKLKYTGTLYSNKGCTKKKGTLKKGSTVYCVGKYPKKIPRGGHPTKIQIKVYNKKGKVVKSGWVKYGPIRSVRGDVAYKSGKAYDYSKSTKEYYVNKKGFSSKTGYLIWLNTYTQMVNVYTGSKGKWKLQKAYRCTTGRFEQPTGLSYNYTIHRRQAKRVRNFLHSSSKYYYRNLSYFSKGNSFHTYCWRVGNNKQVNHVKGNLQPGTMGCVRMFVDPATWIYNNVPLGTKVIAH